MVCCVCQSFVLKSGKDNRSERPYPNITTTKRKETKIQKARPKDRVYIDEINYLQDRHIPNMKLPIEPGSQNRIGGVACVKVKGHAPDCSSMCLQSGLFSSNPTRRAAADDQNRKQGEKTFIAMMVAVFNSAINDASLGRLSCWPGSLSSVHRHRMPDFLRAQHPSVSHLLLSFLYPRSQTPRAIVAVPCGKVISGSHICRPQEHWEMDWA